MNLYCFKCSKFTNKNEIKIKREIDGKINLYSNCINCGFNKFQNIGEEEISDILKSLNCI